MFLPPFLALCVPLSAALQITDIQGPAFRSPFEGVTVDNVTGIVTAKSSTGFYIQGEPSNDVRVSHGLFVFSESSTILNSVAPGDEISISGRVTEFRGSSATDQAFLLSTELESPSNIRVMSTGNKVAPLVLGSSGTRSPPTQQLSALDEGPDGWLSVPNNVSRVDQTNRTVVPSQFGIDFWSSLESVLVTIPKPVGLSFQNDFGEFWVHGDWPVTAKNSRGGLTLTVGPDGIPDGNPETVIIGTPLDGTTNPDVSIGQTFTDITGVIQQQFGFYYILPLTAPETLTLPSPTIPPTTLRKSSDPCTLIIGQYNVDNLAPNSTTLPRVGNQIANSLFMPDIMFLQEIQDNSGPTDDGTVDASITLSTLARSAFLQGGEFLYNFTEVLSVNDQDGGEPGGNIRPAYLFDGGKLRLVPGSPVGGPLDATHPIVEDGKLALTFNPGRLDPTNSLWNSARKPLVALWETTTGQRFITINVHNTAKSSVPGSSTQGDDRPPVNLDVTKRQGQVETISNFIQSILNLDANTSIILAGDFNEYTFTRIVYASLNNIMFDADVLADVPPVERYTFAFDQNTEELDHIFVSKAIAGRGVEVEHVHVNNWQAKVGDRGSDHDPSVARLKVC